MHRDHAGMKAEAIDLTIAAAGSKVTYAGTGVAGLAWLLSSQFFGLMGVLIALAGVLINWHYKRKASQRMELESRSRREESQLRMELMRKTGRVIPDPTCVVGEPAE